MKGYQLIWWRRGLGNSELVKRIHATVNVMEEDYEYSTFLGLGLRRRQWCNCTKEAADSWSASSPTWSALTGSPTCLLLSQILGPLSSAFSAETGSSCLLPSQTHGESSSLLSALTGSG